MADVIAIVAGGIATEDGMVVRQILFAFVADGMATNPIYDAAGTCLCFCSGMDCGPLCKLIL